jgi:hypothetical protein
MLLLTKPLHGMLTVVTEGTNTIVKMTIQVRRGKTDRLTLQEGCGEKTPSRFSFVPAYLGTFQDTNYDSKSYLLYNLKGAAFPDEIMCYRNFVAPTNCIYDLLYICNL